MYQGGVRRARAVVAALLVSTAAAEAGAVELVTVAKEPITLDVTNTATFAWRFDNRNAEVREPDGQIDDHYGEWVDRLNAQLSWWRFRIGTRLDTFVYVDETDRGEAAELADASAVEQGIAPSEADRNKFYRELHTRYLSSFYPAKLWVGYTQPGLDVIAGDFYSQLGRGLVLSVRKIDELGIDTTIRGGKIAFDHTFGEDAFKIGATVLAGQLNPVRVEETSGRRLHGAGSPLFFGFPEIDDFVYFETGTPNTAIPVTEAARPSYLEDTIVAGRVEAGPPWLLFAVNGSLLARTSYNRENLECVAACGNDDACRTACESDFPDFGSEKVGRGHDTIRTFSGSVQAPAIGKHADAYVEVAGQQHRDGHLTALAPAEQQIEDLDGYAIYANVNLRAGPASLSLEGKHYRSFLGLQANIDEDDTTFGAPEYTVVTASQPPTAEPIYVEQLGAPNICMTGGRGRADVRLAKTASVFAWLGHYLSYSEVDAKNYHCDTRDELRTNTWDAAAGHDLKFDEGKSHALAWIGTRITELGSEDNAITPTPLFYREAYVRYDVVGHLVGDFSLQMQGFHRSRYEPIAYSTAWTEGENYAALQWSPHLTAIFGYEYTNRVGCQPGVEDEMCHYFSGGLQWRSASAESVVEQVFDTVQLFVGQRRAAVRCVSGVCRNFPPFEGIRLEIVSRL